MNLDNIDKINSNDFMEHENGRNNKLEKKLFTDNKKYHTKKMFKKFDTSINKNKMLKTNINLDNLSCTKQVIMDDNNRYNKIILSNPLLEKNSVVYKSNRTPLSPLRLELPLNSSINNNYNFNSNYDIIMNKILNKKEKEGDRNITIKNIKLNPKSSILTEMIMRSESLSKNRKENNKSLPNLAFYKKHKRYKIPMPDVIKNKSAFNNNKKILRLNYINTFKQNTNEKRCHPICNKTSDKISIKYLNCTFDKKTNLSNYRTINAYTYSRSNNNVKIKFERNKINHLDYTKTDIKKNNNSEYIKINAIFKNSNISKKLSDSHLIETNRDNKSIGTNEDKTPEKSRSSSENKNKKSNTNTNEEITKKKPIQFINKQKTKNKILNNLNGLANEIMKPSFLKNRVAALLNEKNKDKENKIIQEIKKFNLNINNEVIKENEKNEK
jgi:hypothetical protein